jgi:hypothetical protein
MIDIKISFYNITIHLIYRLCNRQNPKEMRQKMVTDPHRSLSTNPTNLGILLWSTTKLDYQSTTNRPSFGLQSVATRPPIDLLSIDVFDLPSITSNSTFPNRSTLTFDFHYQSIHLDSTFISKNITTQHQAATEIWKD